MAEGKTAVRIYQPEREQNVNPDPAVIIGLPVGEGVRVGLRYDGITSLSPFTLRGEALARLILDQTFLIDHYPEMVRAFFEEVVSKLPKERWELPVAEVLRWQEEWEGRQEREAAEWSEGLSDPEVF